MALVASAIIILIQFNKLAFQPPVDYTDTTKYWILFSLSIACPFGASIISNYVKLTVIQLIALLPGDYINVFAMA